MRRLRTNAITVSCASVAVALTCSPFAHAADAEGVVTGLDGPDLYVDLGALQGATVGARVELWRFIAVVHPTSRVVLRDRFLLGSIKLTEVRTRLSLGRVEDGARHAPAVGDIVVLRKSDPPSSPSTQPVTPPAAPSQPLQPAQASQAPQAPQAPQAAQPSTQDVALAQLMVGLTGKGVTTRVRAYEEFIKSHPDSPHARFLREEAYVLRRTLEPATSTQPDTSGQPSTASPSAKPPLHVRFDPPAIGLTGASMDFSIGLDATMLGAQLHYRTRGGGVYTTVRMEAIGRGYFRARVPALPQAGLEYFIEAISATGTTVAAVASAETPEQLSVRDIEPRAAHTNLYTASLWTDYAAYNVKRDNDSALQVEGLVGARFRDVGLRAVRSGFGVYRGKGGSLEELDRLGRDPREVGLTYGHLEAEFAFTPIVSATGRAIVGLGDIGVRFGAQGFLRIGNDRKTNLSFGGELLGGVGVRGIVELQWNSLPRVPIVFRSEVTNQPAGSTPTRATNATEASAPGDIGARAIAQIGYRWPFALTTSLRVSYQGRTINHAGPGLGAAVSYEW
jgi:hypothetical protein